VLEHATEDLHLWHIFCTFDTVYYFIFL